MQLCYIDESGTPDIPGNTSHFVLAGLATPDRFWRSHFDQVENIKKRYALDQAEIHVAWMMRSYLEQTKIQNFATLPYAQRRAKVEAYRNAELLRLQRANPSLYRQTKTNYVKTANYIHLTFDERFEVVRRLAECIAGWGYARLFAECIDKVHFNPAIAGKTVEEQAFEQVVSRFQWYLQNTTVEYGLLIHDNNQTVAQKHTEMMRKYLKQGTLWARLYNIIETPMFVDSQLTSMIQMVDLCSYALRRYLENKETVLFDLIFQRADTNNRAAVGVRHFTSPGCACKICLLHKAPAVVRPGPI